MSRPDPNSPPAPERVPNLERLSGRETLENQFEHIAAIIRDEDSLAALRESFVNNRSDAKARNDLARADIELAALANQRAEKPSKPVELRLDKQRAALKAERLAIEADCEQKMATTPGPAVNHLRDFFNSAAAYGDYVHAATPTDIKEGESALEANTRLIDEYRTLQEEQKVVTRAHVPAAEVTSACYSYVGLLAAKAPLAPIIGSLRGGFSFDEERGHFNRRQPSVPTDAAALVGIIAALMPDELAGALALKALEGHDESKTLDALARIQKMEAISARMLEIQYLTEANHRFARKRGESAGQRISGNPLAILDLKPA